MHYMFKHYETTLGHPYSSKAFQQYQECSRRCYWSRRFQHDNQTKQTNKQLWSLIDRLTCGVCHYPFCEQDYVIVPSVNMNLIIELNCEKLIVKFKWFQKLDPNFPKKYGFDFVKFSWKVLFNIHICLFP